MKQRLDRAATRHALAALLGAFAVACFAPLQLFWLAPFLWGGLFALLRRADQPRQAALTGFTFGLGFFLTGVSWVYVSLSVFGGMPWWLAGTAAVLFCAALALHPALVAWLFRRYLPQHFWQQALYFACLIALSDWFRSWLFTGFPWLALGYSQSPPSPLAGFAPVLGVFGLSLLTALIGALLLNWRSGLAALVIGGLSGSLLQQVSWTQASGTPITVALIQGNIPQEMKFRPEAFLRTLILYRDLVAEHPATLTLLPETAFPAFIDQLPPDYLAELQDFARRENGDLLFGALSGDIAGQYFNSAISLGQAPTQIYSKQHLVPFGEFIPPGFAWFMAQAHIPVSAFSRGRSEQAPLHIAGQKIAVNICYEDVFGEELAPAAAQAGLLANLSNTAWFGHSLAQPQHLQIAQMRALETGRPMLRATNTGMTAIVSHDGHIQAALPAFTTDVLQAEVQGRDGQTPYLLWRNWAFLLLAIGGLILSQWCRRAEK